ncbi:ECF sigma factor [Acanthopleuribacter pedis]|nr:ECF-type sigma factor [Acanthopleuribacter pedis]
MVLHRWHAGDEAALDVLVETIYPHCLEMIAKRVGPRLTPTFSRHDLAHEVLRNLASMRGRRIESSEHLHNLISRMIYHELADHCKTRQALKRGGGEAAVPFDESWMSPDQAQFYERIMTHQVLERYAEIDSSGAGMFVFYHLFDQGYEEVAERYGVSVSTVKRRIKAARLWLKNQVGSQVGAS